MVPSRRSAHVWKAPASTATAVVMPVTVTGMGVGRGLAEVVTGETAFVVVPSPSWASLLRPQHGSVPLGRRAQEWKAPPVTPVAPVSPTTATGVGLGVSGGLLIVPPPSWP